MEISVHMGLRKGAWTEEEDELLKKCIEKHGIGKWHQVPSKAGLNRCRKSCRLRWLNYLRPNINRGSFTADEVDLIIRLQKLLGNRWSLIAGRVPGRTSNDIKNYWNTNIQKKYLCQREDIAKSKAEKIRKTKIFRPQPHTFSTSLPSTVQNLIFDNLVQIGSTSSDPSRVSSLVDHEKFWWDNMIRDFENNTENTLMFIDNSNDMPVKDHCLSEKVGISGFELGNIFPEEGQERVLGMMFS